MKKEKWFLLVILLYLLVNICGLFVPVIINAAKYAQIGREILDNHDWINLTIGGDAYDQKPPLLFWIAALVFHFFGLSVVAYKTAVILISLLGLYGTYKLAELFYGRNIGLLAAAFLSTTLGYVHFHNDIHTDTLLIVPVILSVWQYAAYFKRKKNVQFYLGCIFAGLGMLAKGPVAIVVIGSAVGLHLICTRNFREIFNYRWLIALPLILLITIPALWGLYDQFGMEGIRFFFWTNNAGRVTGSYAGNNTDPFFYIHTTLYMMAPWTVFTFSGLFLQIREKIQKRWKFTESDEFYTLGGLLFYLVISSAAKAKNPHYEMVVLPFLSILAARWAVLLFEKQDRVKTQKVLGYIHAFIALILILPAFLFLTFIFPENKLWVWMIVIMLTGSLIYVLTWKNSLTKQLTYLLISISIFLFTLNTNALPHISTYQSSFEACRIFNRESGDNEKLHIFTGEARDWEILLYSKSYGRFIITSEDFKRISPPVNDWIYTGPEGVKELEEMNVEVDTVRVMKHNRMSRLTLKFLNPQTRETMLKNRYLLKIRAKRF
ncbi:MAG: glycosyltransferase family 39 protein [Prolixibacteraceae bacterium]